MGQIGHPLPTAAVPHEMSSLLDVSSFPKEREQRKELIAKPELTANSTAAVSLMPDLNGAAFSEEQSDTWGATLP